MEKQWTIGVLAPILNGSYYTGMLNGIHKAVLQIGGRLIAVQTDEEKRTTHPLYNVPLAYEHVDGWIVLLEAINDSFFHRLKNMGKPIICVSSNSKNCDFPIIRTNNYRGMFDAVEHLIGHGHTRIAFVGKLKHFDIYSRYLGYRAALKKHNITFDRRIIYSVESNLLKSGHDGAKMLLSDQVPCTAIAAGCDANAVGIMEKLKEAGYQFPQDLAIVGYDDIAIAHTAIPSLTTVSSPVDVIAQTAVSHIIQQNQKNTRDKTTVYIPDRLIIRHSCGCSNTVIEHDNDQPLEHEVNIKVLQYLENVIYTNIEIGKNLINAISNDVKSLKWLTNTNIKWGCLGLWETNSQGERRLKVEQIYQNPQEKTLTIGRAFRIEEFPPVMYLPESTHSGGTDIVTLHSIRSEKKEWGIIALVSPIDSLSMWYNYSGTMTHSFNLLAAALERESLIDDLRERERRYSVIVEQLEIVSRTTNDGIWDWNLITDQVEWNNRINKILGIEQGKIESDSSGIFNYVHPDDLPAVRNLLRVDIHNRKSFEIEYRMKRNEEYVWVYMAGEVIRDKQSKPIRMIGSIRDITKRKQNEEQITHLAYHDALTGLPNRMLFMDHLEQSLALAEINHSKLAVLLLDLDRFKAINDTYGHLVGDRLLIFVCSQLKKTINNGITIARLGGDEFIILMPEINQQEAASAFSEKVLDVLRVPFVDESLEFSISCSIGISYYPENGKDADTLIKHADLAMYRAKNRGGDSYQAYSALLS